MDHCIAKDSCDEDCGICGRAESLDSCEKIGFCEWITGIWIPIPITTADILFVVASVMLEFYTSFLLYMVVFLSVFSECHPLYTVQY